MKYLIYILSAFLFVIVSVTTMNAMGIRNINKLSGYIESWSDYSIRRIDLATGKSEEIFRKNQNINIGNYLIYFDISPDGKERVLATTGSVSTGCKDDSDNPTKLLIYTDDKKLTTIMNKAFVGYPSFSPDGKFIAYLFSQYEKEKKNWVGDQYLYLISSDGSSDKQVSKISCDIHKPSWFPDGKKLAVGSKNLDICIIDIRTGTEKRIIDFGMAPSVSHDGKKIVYMSKEVDASVKTSMVGYQKITMKEYKDTYMNKKDKQKEMELATLFQKFSIFIYDVASGKSKKLTDELFVSQSDPLIWSPDDKYILYTDRKWEGLNIYALNIETAEKQKVTYGIAMGWVY